MTNLPWFEITANALLALSIFLAGRNSVHTWWTGIVACGLFGALFFRSQLYADATLQVFFVITSALGWVHWHRRRGAEELPVRRAPVRALVIGAVAAVAVTLGYGWLLHRFTDAYAPFADSVVLACSVVGQLLLMGRRVESWWCWLIVNTVAVPLYFSRGLNVTAVLYVAFWINAVISLRRWRRLASEADAAARTAAPSMSRVSPAAGSDESANG